MNIGWNDISPEVAEAILSDALEQNDGSVAGAAYDVGLTPAETLGWIKKLGLEKHVAKPSEE